MRAACGQAMMEVMKDARRGEQEGAVQRRVAIADSLLSDMTA